MKTIKIFLSIILLITISGIQAQKVVLKKLNTTDLSNIKKLSKSQKLIPFNDRFVGKKGKTGSTITTKVSKTEGSNLSDKISKGTTAESEGKNCDKASVSYTISSKKLVPVDPTMSIKLGNVYDINLFRSGNYTPIKYQFLNEGLIYVGGKSTSNRGLTKVDVGVKNTDFQIALSDFTQEVKKEYLTQRMSQNFELIYGTSEKMLNAKLGAGYSDKLGNQAKLNSSLDLSSTKQIYTAIYKEENYAEELDMNGGILMQPETPNENLVYVSEIVYGKLGFFEYTSSVDFMKFNLNASASGSYLGASLSATLQVSALSNDTTGQIVTKLFGSKSDSQIPQTKEAFIAWANQTPSTNAMIPVGFVLKFVNDNATAFFLTSGTEPLEICSSKPKADNKFDVKIQLESISIDEVHEGVGDWKEDLFGTQGINSVDSNINGIKKPKIPKSVNLWTKDEEGAKKNGYEVGETISINKNIEIKNLTEAELKSLIIVMGGKMYDYEFIGGSRIYQCLNCNKPQNNPYQRTYEFDDNDISNINTLGENAPYKSVNKDFIELKYREGSSKIRALYKIYVKKY